MIYLANSQLYPHSLTSVKKILKGLNLTVSFVDKKTMAQIGKTYYKKDKKIHKVFSFVDSEVKDFPQTDSLGEIVVCYELINNEKETLDLIHHSVLHLQGIHHPEE